MRKVIITNLLILAVFGSTCFWSVKKDRLTASVDKILAEQTEGEEEILVLTSSDLVKKVDRIQQKTISSGWTLPSPNLLWQRAMSTIGIHTERIGISAGSICWHGQRHTPVESLEMTGRSEMHGRTGDGSRSREEAGRTDGGS